MIHVLALLARKGHGKTTIANYFHNEYGTRTVSLAGPLKKIAQAALGFSDAQLWGTQAEKEAPAFLGPAAFTKIQNAPATADAFGLGTEIEEAATSARVFLQRLGTEGIRKNLGETVWLEALLYGIRTDYAARMGNAAANDNARGVGERGAARATGPSTDAVYVVDDVRFINEVQFIQRLTMRTPGYTIKRDAEGVATSASHEPKFFGSVIKLVCTDAPASGDDGHASEAEVDRVPPTMIDGTAVSSLALGTAHLIEQVEGVLSQANLANLRGALNRVRRARAAADRDRAREEAREAALDRVVKAMRERTSGG